MVKILGDVTGLGKSFTGAQQKGQSAAQGMHSAFSGMLGTLNSTGALGPFGNALQTADQSMQNMGEHAKSTGLKMAGVGGAAAGVGLALSALGSKDQAAHAQLQASITATGHSYDQYSKQVEEAIGHQEKFGNTADETQGALRVLTSATHDPTEALKLLNTATDLAAAKHEDLTSAAGQLGKAYNGSARIFKEFGIVVTKNKDGTKDYKGAVDQLGQSLGGQASAQANTFTGHLHAMRAEITDHVSLFAQKYGPAIGTAGIAMAGLGSAIEITKNAVNLLKIGQAAQAVASGVATAATWLWNLALEANPVVLIATLIGVVLVGAIVLIVTHFNTFKAVVLDVWNAVVVAFDAIKNAIMGVYNWVAANWPLLLAILTGPFGLAVFMIVTYWNNIVSFFSGIPGDIKNAIGDVTNLLYDIGMTIINSLKRGAEDAWKAVEGFFSGVAKKVGNFLKNPLSIFSPSKVMMEQGKFIMQGLGLGITAGFDQHVQPALDATVAALTPARGGGVSAGAGGLAPAMASSSSGPAVVVNNAHFTSGVDVDAFMRRAAWVARNRI
jgi:phage-related protein